MRKFNLAYQVQRHVAIALHEARQRPRWPQDATEIKRRITRALKAGKAWLFHEPTQMELFDHA